LVGLNSSGTFLRSQYAITILVTYFKETRGWIIWFGADNDSQLSAVIFGTGFGTISDIKMGPELDFMIRLSFA
jgi:hypothetical protein